MDDEVNKYGVALSVWSTLGPKEKNRIYRGYSSKKIWAEASPEKRQRQYARAKDIRLANLEQRRAKDRERYRINAERRKAQQHESYWRHHDKVLARARAKWAKASSQRAISRSPDAVMEMIDKAVSNALPRFIRDEVVSAMCLAVLEGQLMVEDVSKEAKLFLRAYNREYDTFKTVSLDAPLAGTEGLTLLDKLAGKEEQSDIGLDLNEDLGLI